MKTTKSSIIFVLLLILVCGFSLSYGAFQFSQEMAQKENSNTFKRYVDQYVSSIDREIALHIEVLRNLNSFVIASKPLSRDGFRLYSAPIVERYDTIQALEWVPRVDASQRSDFESKARADGFANFTFTERNDQGDLHRSKEKEQYFPVYFLEPYIGNELVMGFDVSSSSNLMGAMARVRDNGEMFATKPIRLIQGGNGLQGILIFSPIYEGGIDTLAERRAHLKGYVLAVIRSGGIVKRAIAYTRLFNDDIAVKMTDVTELGPQEIPSSLVFEGSEAKSAKLIEQRFIRQLGRTWMIEIRALPEFTSEQTARTSLLMLISGVAFTVMIALFVFFLMNRERSIRKLVDARTNEIESSK